MKFHIVSFGCQMNRSDAERIRTVLSAMGLDETDDENQASVLGIVSCSVRQKAIDRVYGRIRNWNRFKATRPLVTFVTGCVLPKDREKFLKLFDLVFPVDELPKLPDMIRQYGVALPLAVPSSGERSDAVLYLSNDPWNPGAPMPGEHGRQEAQEKIEAFWQVSPSYSSDVEAYVPIQNGCDKFCSFCAVPYTRGREVSRPSAEILAELRRLVKHGYKSITLLGQNVNSYGLDKEGRELTFSQLMQAIGEIGKDSGAEFWTYFTSPHPRDITEDLLETMASYPVLAKWVHLPLQSGDDKVLLKMNRNHSMERYRKVVADIRRLLPTAALFTDIIVGFTGESDEQFAATRAAMEEFDYDMAYIAQYSPRPGAVSSRWEDDIPAEEKHRRFTELSDLLVARAKEKAAGLPGTKVRVLVTGVDERTGHLSGYTEGRMPVRLEKDCRVPVGQFLDLEITGTTGLSLEGRPA